MPIWIRACATTEVDDEDVLGFEHDGRHFCVYNTEKGWFASDGHCTHEEELLEDGMVIGTIIECPLHQGRFDVTTGRALGAPACVNLTTYPVKIGDGAVWIEI